MLNSGNASNCRLEICRSQTSQVPKSRSRPAARRFGGAWLREAASLDKGVERNGMDAPTLIGIDVPKWMCRATTTNGSVHHEDYNDGN
jgi:hypothetical protein